MGKKRSRGEAALSSSSSLSFEAKKKKKRISNSGINKKKDGTKQKLSSVKNDSSSSKKKKKRKEENDNDEINVKREIIKQEQVDSSNEEHSNSDSSSSDDDDDESLANNKKSKKKNKNKQVISSSSDDDDSNNDNQSYSSSSSSIVVKVKSKKHKKDDEKKKKDDEAFSFSSSFKKNKATGDSLTKTTKSVITSTDMGFEWVQVEVTVAVFPAALRQLKYELQAALQSHLLLHHIPHLEGLVLALDPNIVIVKDDNNKNGLGRIVNDMPQIHYKLETSLLLYCPRIQQSCLGIITECFDSHVSLLVHGCIHASLSARALLEAGFVRDEEKKKKKKNRETTSSNDELTWQMTTGAGVKELQRHVAILFTISKIHQAGGAISLEGEEPQVVE